MAVFYTQCFVVLLFFFLIFFFIFIFFLFLFFFFYISIFRNELLLQIKTVQLNMYAEYGQLHTSNTDLLSLEGRISLVVNLGKCLVREPWNNSQS